MLSITNLTRRFGDHTVLDRFALDVPAGGVACLVGPSGCGKSTLLRLVAGLDHPDEGQISVGDRVISAPGWALEPHKRRLNMVFQDYALWPHMTVRRIVGYGLNRLPGAERDARVSALLDLMQICALADRLPSQISGGQQQRVAIARALATDPDILLFDEPLSNLDVQLRIEMRREFSDLFRKVGKTVLYVTHDPLEACSFADTLVVMKAGTIEQSGTPEALFARPASAWIATLAGYDTTLDGTVVGRADGDLMIDVEGQVLRLDAGNPLTQETGRVTVMLHPGSIMPVDAATSGEPNVLAGTVTHSMFEGRGWRLVVSTGTQMVSLLADRKTPIGETLRMRFAREGAVVFPK